MRPGFVIELQQQGALVLRKQTTNIGTAMHYYRLYLSRCHNAGSVIVLHNEREITGFELRAMFRAAEAARKVGA